MRFLPRLVIFFLGIAATVHAQPSAQPVAESITGATGAVSSRLVAQNSTITPGSSFDVMWSITLEPHWHVYWQNPGDSGLAPMLEPQQGFTASPLTFPTPKVIDIPPVTNYGYENRVLLKTTLTAPKNLPQGPISLPIKLSYLYCMDVCMPGELTLQLPLNVGQQSAANPNYPALLQAHLNSMPQPLPANAHVRVMPQGKNLVVTINASALNNPQSLRFIPAKEEWLHDSAPQTYTNGTLTLSPDPYAPATPAKLEGLLLLPNGKAYTLSQPVGALTSQNTNSSPTTGLTVALFFAFLAGLILNAMPCVLPVLSLKILSLIRTHSHHQRHQHTLMYTLGVLASFWAFAIILALLKATGHQLGWGFHLQNPYFVAGLATLMLAVALNFFDIFTLGQSLTRLGSAPQSRTRLSHSVATGVLAVVVATPCTVPFMGGAMAYALNQSILPSLAVFTALGLGMAFPFLLISMFPRLIKWLPKPGAWMSTFRHILGWPMLATSLWLLWVFANQTNTHATFLLLGVLLLFSFSLWLTQAFTASRWPMLLPLAALICGFWILSSTSFAPSTANTQTQTHANSSWQPWSAQAVQTALNNNQSVFVDFTADWCLTCKVVEATVLNTEHVQSMFKANNVALFRADWTRQNTTITEELAKHGRKGVPLYLAYTNGNASPTILPQIPTFSLLQQTFAKP